MPQRTTMAMVTTWPPSRRRSRSSLRSSIVTRRSPRRQAIRIGRNARDHAVGQPHHAVGHAGDRRVVGDHDGGGAELAVDAGDRLEHDDAGVVVERAGRLVAQQHVGPLGDGARDRDPLLLAAGELRREVVQSGRPGRPARSASSGAHGIAAISVTSATFSRAVRLGIRL